MNRSPPKAFVVGRETFMGRDFACERGVLAPRAVTASVVTEALHLIARIRRPIVVDVGCGSGNIGFTVALEHPGARVFCTDLLPASVALARRNAEALGILRSGRVHVRRGDLFAALAGDALEGKVDAIVTSPPFISSGKLDKESAHLLEFEPREAFDAGPYGLSMHQRLVKEALPWLAPGGHLVCECGEGQAKQVRMLYERTRSYDAIAVGKDSAGVERVVLGRKAA